MTAIFKFNENALIAVRWGRRPVQKEIQMTDLIDQIERLGADLEQRRAELTRLDLSPRQRAAMSRLEVAHVGKMRTRLEVEINELERYIKSMGRLVQTVGGQVNDLDQVT